ncbi:MAG: ABC transporter, partial [Acidobacteriota bacterium]
VSAPVSVPPNTPDADAKKESRVIVIGDSDFAANRAIGIQGNRELFLNMANWLAQQENLIAIRPKNPDDRPITMTVDQQRTVFWFTLVLVPGLLFLNGIRVWWKRR